MDLVPVALPNVEYGKDYYVEFRRWDGGIERRPSYRARIRSIVDGVVTLDRAVMSSTSPSGSRWDHVRHPASDLFVYELPYDPKSEKVGSAP